MTLALSGSVALVTGASRGIGAVVATRLAESGADVVVCGRDLSKCTTSLPASRPWADAP